MQKAESQPLTSEEQTSCLPIQAPSWNVYQQQTEGWGNHCLSAEWDREADNSRHREGQSTQRLNLCCYNLLLGV